MSSASDVIARWSARLRDFLPGFAGASPAMAALAATASIVMHGSTTRGIDDEHSDLDLWVMVGNEELRAYDCQMPTRFIEFKLDGKAGHLNLEAREDLAQRLRHCDFHLISELRTAQIIADPTGIAGALIAAARRPMRDQVRRAWFCFHYVEMRGEHRACDTPIERGDALALLQALVPAISHAMKAAMVLDGQPYPYCKWLAQASAQTPTGALLAPKLADLLDIFAHDGLRQGGPEKQHPLSLKLREIRRLLIDAARAGGIDEPWLEKWWLHIPQAREGIRAVEW